MRLQWQAHHQYYPPASRSCPDKQLTRRRHPHRIKTCRVSWAVHRTPVSSEDPCALPVIHVISCNETMTTHSQNPFNVILVNIWCDGIGLKSLKTLVFHDLKNLLTWRCMFQFEMIYKNINIIVPTY